MMKIKGTITYHIEIVTGENTKPEAQGLYSPALAGLVYRRNVPLWRTVCFDGRNALIREKNGDYGFESPCFRLMAVGEGVTRYGKEFRHFNFVVEFPRSVPIGGPPSSFSPLPGEKTICGVLCRKGEYLGNRHLTVWYAEELSADDETGAVIHLSGVPGLIMEMEPWSDSVVSEGLSDIGPFERVTVSGLFVEPPPKELFDIPKDYRRFENLESVRKEDRRLTEEKAEKESKTRPLSEMEKNMFTGTWIYRTDHDTMLREIIRIRENEFLFRTTVITAPVSHPERVREEKAVMKARLLLVEQQPDYRLYSLSENGRLLVPLGFDDFPFIRSE